MALSRLLLALLAALPFVRLHSAGGHRLTRAVQAQIDAREARRRATFTVPTLTGEVYVVREDHGLCDILVDGVRVEERDGRYTVAEDRPAEGIELAVEVTNVWLFLSNRKVIYRSAHFTSPLQHFATIPCGGFRLASPMRGRLVFGYPDGSQWSTDGRRAPTRLALPGPSSNVVFASERRGEALLADGRLVLTNDGGATW